MCAGLRRPCSLGGGCWDLGAGRGFDLFLVSVVRSGARTSYELNPPKSPTQRETSEQRAPGHSSRRKPRPWRRVDPQQAAREPASPHPPPAQQPTQGLSTVKEGAPCTEAQRHHRPSPLHAIMLLSVCLSVLSVAPLSSVPILTAADGMRQRRAVGRSADMTDSGVLRHCAGSSASSACWPLSRSLVIPAVEIVGPYSCDIPSFDPIVISRASEHIRLRDLPSPVGPRLQPSVAVSAARDPTPMSQADTRLLRLQSTEAGDRLRPSNVF